MSDDEDDVTLEGTLALIKPDAIAKEEAIMDRIRYVNILKKECLRDYITGTRASWWWRRRGCASPDGLRKGSTRSTDTRYE